MYLGIDLGSSEVKAVLLASDGSMVGTCRAALSLSRPQPLWAEQAPEDWWSATQAVVAGLRASYPAPWRRVRAIGLSGQMHGAVLLDRHDRVLRPAILWNDGRSHHECEQLSRVAPGLHEITGNLAMPGFTAPKLLWVRRHEPSIFAATATVLLPKDYLRLRLTGEKVSDCSDAAGTLWLDMAARDWSGAMLAACGLSRRQMPRLVEGNAASAMLRADIAQAWGLSRSVMVAGGAGDNAASAVGLGAVQPGDGFISLGTSGVLFAVSDGFRPNAAGAVHAFCHALPGRWHQMGVMLSAASCLRWFMQISGAGDEAQLLAEVASLRPAMRDRAPLFLPYLGGERTPHNDPFASGTLHRLDHETSRAACTYAVLEGVAFGMLDCLNSLGQSGTKVERLSLVGGGAKSPAWAQLIADVLEVDILLRAGAPHAAALGAARLAWLAAGEADEARVCTAPEALAEFRPDGARSARLRERYRDFRALYQHLNPITRGRHAG